MTARLRASVLYPAGVVASALLGCSSPPCGVAAGMDVAASDAALSDATMDTGAGPTSDATTDAASGDGSDGAPEPAGDAASDGPGPTPVDLAAVRLANWSPDVPAVDFCLAPAGTSAFQGPLLAAVASKDAGVPGLSFPQVSVYIYVKPDAFPAQYTARLVVAGSTDCSTPLTSDLTTLPALAAGAFATVVTTGFANPATGGPALELLSYLDTSIPTANGVKLRFIHASPGVGPVDFGTGSTAFSALAPGFTNVPFGGRSVGPDAGAVADGGATVDAGPQTVDQNGYFAASALSGTTLSARLHADAVVLASGSAFDAAGSIVTIALVGMPSAPALVQCVDNAAAKPGDFRAMNCAPIPP